MARIAGGASRGADHVSRLHRRRTLHDSALGAARIRGVAATDQSGSGATVFAPFAGRACCSFGLPFDPEIVTAKRLEAALAPRRPVRPEISSILRLNPQPSVEIIADEDSGLSGGRIE